MRRFLLLLLCAVGACLYGQSPLSETKRTEWLAPSEASSLERKLVAILKVQKELFDAPQKYTKEELSRRLAALAADYANLLADYPRDIYLRIHYAKFLKTVGETEHARRVLTELLSDRDDIGVVYQLLANIYAEKGDYATAWPLLLDCVRLEPDVALYRYQLGEFLAVFRDLLVADNYMTYAELDAKMRESFDKACALDPQSRALAWRRAQAFYDMKQPDAAAALAAWERAEALTPDPIEAPVLRLHRARWLVALKRFDEAAALLKKPVPQPLEKNRRDLLRQIPSAL